jgi:hypothetical protein
MCQQPKRTATIALSIGKTHSAPIGIRHAKIGTSTLAC